MGSLLGVEMEDTVRFGVDITGAFTVPKMSPMRFLTTLKNQKNINGKMVTNRQTRV